MINRSLEGENSVKNFKLFIYLALGLYLMLLIKLIIFKYPDAMTQEIIRTWTPESVLRQMTSVNIIPFRTIWNSLFNATLPVQLPTLIYNIVAFIPLGFLVPLISERAQQFAIVLIIAFAISTSFELIQVFTRLGEGDIDDVILNVTGAIIGYGVFALVIWWKPYFVRFRERVH